MDEDREERRGFRVTDRRRFSEAGETKADAPDASAPASSPEASPTTAGGAEPADERARPALEAVTFSTFVLGLSTQALLHLGEIPDPTTQRLDRDLPAAKHVIDILGILQDKTRNNLEPGEQSLLDSVLYDLRMRYVELVRPGAKEST
jgi:uncharacterized protein DUF1844